MSEQPYLDDDFDKPAKPEVQDDIDVDAELRSLITEYLEKTSEDPHTSEAAQRNAEARADAMHEVLDSDAVRGGQDLHEAIAEVLPHLHDAAKKVKDAHGRLKGNRYIPGEWNAATDSPKTAGHWDSGEKYPPDVAKELDDIYTHTTALLSLDQVATELEQMRDGKHKRWNRPGDIHGDARIGFVASLRDQHGYPFSWLARD